MQLISADPPSLKENPDRSRQSNSSPQSDALLCASIKAVGVVQPPVVKADPDGGNGLILVFGHRRAAQAIAAELAEIPLLLAEPSDNLAAMQALAENIAREPLNPVDQWRAIERLVALGWTEESIALALALGVRQVRTNLKRWSTRPGIVPIVSATKWTAASTRPPNSRTATTG